MSLPDPTFEKEFPVRYYELDSHGNVSPVTLLNYLQDTAGLHAAQLGVAVSDLRRLGLNWRYPSGPRCCTVRPSFPAVSQGRMTAACTRSSTGRTAGNWLDCVPALRRQEKSPDDF
jgi:acyl-ACP thioesterase-like protein